MSTELICVDVRAALSALLDGEETGVGDSLIAEHLDGCAGCRDFRGRAIDVNVAVLRAAPAPPPAADLTARVLAAATSDPGARQRTQTQRAKRQVLRVSLAVTVVGQLLLAFPLLTGLAGSAESRLSWETGALSLAVAVGFGFAAARPSVAVGMLPIALVLSVMFAVDGVRDVIGDPLTAAYHMGHVVVLLQAGLLWSLARTPLPRPRRAGSSADTVRI